MSRIGKHPVTVPAGVTVNLEGQQVSVKGKLGELSQVLPKEVDVTQEDGAIRVAPRDEKDKRCRQMWGLSRTLVQNMVTGVTEGFTRRLVISGVGFRAAADNEMLTLQLGYSHDIKFAIPKDVQIKTDGQTAVVISGAEKRRVGQIAAEIRAFRKPEPYKGKGIRYSDEVILRKEGKKK